MADGVRRFDGVRRGAGALVGRVNAVLEREQQAIDAILTDYQVPLEPLFRRPAIDAQANAAALVAEERVSFRVAANGGSNEQPCNGHRVDPMVVESLFLIIAIGTEAGIANVWKFSYLAGANGGGLFVALYFIALILVAIPALMAEMLIGRHGGRSAVGTMNILVARDGISPFWKIFGVMASIAVFLILSYYCVICGWMVNYFVFGLSGGFKAMDAPEPCRPISACSRIPSACCSIRE